jgi:hypothetical protein
MHQAIGPDVADLAETYDLTTPSQHGWAVDYRIRRDDGEELHAEVRCWDEARTAAERAGNANALEAIADRGLATALEYAEIVESPRERGAVMISIWLDPADNGNLRVASATSAGQSEPGNALAAWKPPKPVPSEPPTRRRSRVACRMALVQGV